MRAVNIAQIDAPDGNSVEATRARLTSECALFRASLDGTVSVCSDANTYANAYLMYHES